MSQLSKVRKLSRYERGLLLRSVLLLPTVHFLLALLGFYRLRSVMERLTRLKTNQLPSSKTEIMKRAGEISRMVSIAAQHGIYRATCLRRSLLVWWLLRRESIPGQICFGVRTADGRLEAHAWVEYNGIAVNEPENIHEEFQLLQDVLPSTNSGL